MSALDLLGELRGLDVRLEAEGDRLVADAPVGVLTPGLRQALADCKPDIMRLLSSGVSAVASARDGDAAAPPWRGAEVRWARERGWLRVLDPKTGEWHEVPARECPESWRRDANRRRP